MDRTSAQRAGEPAGELRARFGRASESLAESGQPTVPSSGKPTPRAAHPYPTTLRANGEGAAVRVSGGHHAALLDLQSLRRSRPLRLHGERYPQVFFELASPGTHDQEARLLLT